MYLTGTTSENSDVEEWIHLVELLSSAPPVADATTARGFPPLMSFEARTPARDPFCRISETAIIAPAPVLL